MDFKTASDTDKILEYLGRDGAYRGVKYHVLIENVTTITPDRIRDILHLLNYREYVSLSNQEEYFLTGSGMLFFKDGGFVAQKKKENQILYSAIIAAIASVLGLIIGLIAIFK